MVFRQAELLGGGDVLGFTALAEHLAQNGIEIARRDLNAVHQANLDIRISGEQTADEVTLLRELTEGRHDGPGHASLPFVRQMKHCTKPSATLAGAIQFS